MSADEDSPTRMVKGNRRSKNQFGQTENSSGGANLFEDVNSPSFKHETVQMEGNSTHRMTESMETIETVVPTNIPDRTTKPVRENDDLTRLAFPKKKPTEQVESNFMKDPIVGWVVIIKGSGQGTSLQIGLGMNSIGRDDDQRIQLNFGDEQISRSSHATISYDSKGRLFYLQHGGGRNLTYIDNGEALAPVLSPVVIVSGDKIQMGDTVLHFIAFCDENFDWSDVVSE